MDIRAVPFAQCFDCGSAVQWKIKKHWADDIHGSCACGNFKLPVESMPRVPVTIDLGEEPKCLPESS